MKDLLSLHVSLQSNFHKPFGSVYTRRHGAGAVAVAETKMVCIVPYETIYMWWHHCRRRCAMLIGFCTNFSHGKNAIHRNGAVSVSCKRTLSVENVENLKRVKSTAESNFRMCSVGIIPGDFIDIFHIFTAYLQVEKSSWWFSTFSRLSINSIMGKLEYRSWQDEVHLALLGPVYTCDFSSLLRLFYDKMGVEPNWRIYRTTIARAQKLVKNRKYKRGLRLISIDKKYLEVH